MERIVYSIVDTLSRIITSPVFWAIVALLVLSRLLVSVYRKIKLRALEMLSYTRRLSTDGSFAGDSFTLTEILHNNSFFPLFSVKMEFFVPKGFTVDKLHCLEYTKVTSVFHIPPRASVTKTHTVRTDLRGHYRLDTAVINYRLHEFLFPAPLEIRVYPSYSSLNTDILPDIFRAGEKIAKRKYMEDPFFISEIRHYQPGDPMRSINFKASGRSFSHGTRQLMVNSYDSSRNFDAMVFLDLFNYAELGENEESRFEYSLSAACYLLSETVRNGGAVGFASNASSIQQPYVYIPCSSGNTHIKNILDRLAEISYYNKREYSISSLIERFAETASRSVDIYLIAPIVDSKTAATLRRLENSGRSVCVIPIKNAEGTTV